jgi:hypothetical protein
VFDHRSRRALARRHRRLVAADLVGDAADSNKMALTNLGC